MRECEVWKTTEEIGLTDSHEFFHLLPFHALLELALLGGAEAETGEPLVPVPVWSSHQGDMTHPSICPEVLGRH